MSALRDPYAPRVPPGQDELPCDDGEPMETQRHLAQMHLLIETLADAWVDRADAYVNGNMAIYFSELQTRRNDFRGPDVFVVLDTVKKERKSWVAWEEGKLPDVVVELTSPSTAEVDRGEKMRIYSRQWRTGTYVIYDPITCELEGYTLSAHGDYERIVPDARGDLPIPRIGLAIGLRDIALRELPAPFLRWIDAEGNALPTGVERANVAERRVAELEAALRTRGGS